MAIASYSMFNQFKDRIQALPADLPTEVMLVDSFLLETDEKKNLEIYYAPFEYVNEKAKVAIVGITPGLHQMRKAYETVLNVKDRQLSDEEILRLVKYTASFDGPMRRNLVQMLDELGLHQHLGLSSTLELFHDASYLAHATSVLPYPVFYKGKNYSGSNPNILKNDLLKKYITEKFAVQMRMLDKPLIIPLGVNVLKVINFLNEQELIDEQHLLLGFPHPSGSNGHRIKQFNKNKIHMAEMLRRYFQG